MPESPTIYPESRKRNGVIVGWRVVIKKWPGGDPPFRSRSVPTEDAGKALAARLIKEWEAEQRVEHAKAAGGNDATLTLSEYFGLHRKAIYGDRVLGGRTAVGYDADWRLRIEPKFGARVIATITRREVRRWISELEAGPSTKHNTCTVLAKIFGYAERMEHVPEDPTFKLFDFVESPESSRLKRGDALELDEVIEMADTVDPHYRFLVLFLASSGLRINEALALTWADIRRMTEDRLEVTIDKQWERVGPSGGRRAIGDVKTVRAHRTIPVWMMPETREAFDAYQAKWGSDRRDYVFRTPSGVPVQDGPFRAKVWRPACDAVNRTHKIHGLRHFAVSFWIMANVNRYEIARWIGHADPGFTEKRYGHWFDRLKNEMMNPRYKAGMEAASRRLRGDDDPDMGVPAIA